MKKINVDFYGMRMVKEKTVLYNVAEKVEMNSPKSVDKIAREVLELHEQGQEQFWILCLNTKNEMVGIHMVSQGSLNSAIVHPREVFTRAIHNNAQSIILMHNHPSGNPQPSREDIDLTHRLMESGKILGIEVLDHIVIGEHSFLSMREKMII